MILPAAQNARLPAALIAARDDALMKNLLPGYLYGY